jgi:hypothetical protein
MRPKKLTIFFEGIKNISGIIIALKYSQYAFTAVIELDPSFIPASVLSPKEHVILSELGGLLFKAVRAEPPVKWPYPAQRVVSSQCQ